MGSCGSWPVDLLPPLHVRSLAMQRQMLEVDSYPSCSSPSWSGPSLCSFLLYVMIPLHTVLLLRCRGVVSIMRVLRAHSHTEPDVAGPVYHNRSPSPTGLFLHKDFSPHHRAYLTTSTEATMQYITYERQKSMDGLFGVCPWLGTSSFCNFLQVFCAIFCAIFCDHFL